MPEERVSTRDCHKYRVEIFSAIFPRWALFIVISFVSTILGIVFFLSVRNSYAASTANSNARDNKTTFTLEVEHVKEGQARMEDQLTAQHTLLMNIDKKVDKINGGD